MRILSVSNYYPPFEIGGWEQLTYDVNHRLVQRGHDVQVLTSRHRANEITAGEDGVFRLLHLDSPDHERYHLEYIFTKLWRERQNKYHIQRLVKQFDPDIIFINGMWNLHWSVAAHLEMLCPKRVVYYVASYWPTETDSFTRFWNAPASRPWSRILKKIFGLFRKNFNNPEGLKSNALEFRRVFCVSEYVRNYLIDEVGISDEQVKVIYNGIDPNKFPGVEKKPVAEGLKILYAGRLNPDKGVHTVIDAIAELHTKKPQLKVKLTILGGGTRRYRQMLEKKVSDAHIEDRVTFHRPVARHAMPEFMQEHDVLVFPSEWPEPLARIVQEAMASGLVVIGTETGGTPEILSDNENGLTFEAGNSHQLADQIARIVGDVKLRVLYSDRAKQTVLDRFTIERMVDELENEFLAMRNKARLYATT